MKSKPKYSPARQAVIDQQKANWTAWLPRLKPATSLPDVDRAIAQGFPVTRCPPAHVAPLGVNMIQPRSRMGSGGRVR